MADAVVTYNSEIIPSPFPLPWNDRHRCFSALQKSFKKIRKSRTLFISILIHLMLRIVRNRNFDPGKFIYFSTIRIYVKSSARTDSKGKRHV